MRTLRFAVATLGALLSAHLAGCSDQRSTTTTCVSAFDTAIDGDEVTLDNPVSEMAQSFTAAGDAQPANVVLKLKGVGLPTGSLILTLESGATAPDGVALATATLEASTILNTQAADYLFSFPTPHPLIRKGKVYWVHLRGSSGLSATNAIQWLGNDENGFAGGLFLVRLGSAWSQLFGPARDCLFKVGCG